MRECKEDKQESFRMVSSNFEFPYISEMRTLLVGADFLKKGRFDAPFQAHGKVKLFSSRIFLRDPRVA